MDTSEFTDEQIKALQALADGYNDQSVSRRDVMKLAGAGGVGALLGGGGAVAAAEPASAGTAQSGQLGAIGDALDLVIEDLIDQQGNVVASANAGALEGTDLWYESVNAGQINNIQYADPDVTDMAAELNSLITNAKNRDVIVVPPGDYVGNEQVLVDKEVIITGFPQDNSRVRESAPAYIDFSASFTGPAILVTAKAVVSHLEIKNTGENKEAGLRTHAQFSSDRLSVDGDFNYLLHLHERDGDNLNGSVVTGFKGHGRLNSSTHGIFLQTDVDTNIQPQQIHANDIVNTQYGIENQGRGGDIVIAHYDPLDWLNDAATTKTVIDANVYNSYRILYNELPDVCYETKNVASVGNPGGHAHVELGDVSRGSTQLYNHTTTNSSVIIHQGDMILADKYGEASVGRNNWTAPELSYKTTNGMDIFPYDGFNVDSGTTRAICTLSGPFSFAFVAGIQSGATGRNFLDVIIASADAETATKQFGTEANNPGTRTYTVNAGKELEISLADDGTVTASYGLQALSHELMSNY